MPGRLLTNVDAYAAAGMRILERDGDTICAELDTTVGPVVLVANVLLAGRSLVFDGVHVDGRGLTLARIRELAKVAGQVEDVEEVRVQGGVRTSGARPGSVPTPIRVKVKR
jgi:hypothetical protein